jgi:hypothetical protein
MDLKLRIHSLRTSKLTKTGRIGPPGRGGGEWPGYPDPGTNNVHVGHEKINVRIQIICSGIRIICSGIQIINSGIRIICSGILITKYEVFHNKTCGMKEFPVL